MPTESSRKIVYYSQEIETEINELTRDMTPEIILLAAIAYGEASTLNDSEEIGGIAFAVANRARAYKNKTIQALITKEPHYTYAAKGKGNERYRLIVQLQDPHRYKLLENPDMRSAIRWAKKALKNEGVDPSNGAFWWDGLDIKINYNEHPKVRETFHFSDPKHNIFEIKETSRKITGYWHKREKKTNQLVKTTPRGTYQHVWLSTAAHGKTIFWTYDSDYLKTTGALPYL